jgi:hypothetical protein
VHFDSIYPLLAIKLQGRNEAIGLRGITGQVANLLELYISSRQELAIMREAAGINIGVQYGYQKFREALNNVTTIEEKRELLGFSI